jgi:T5SS/PEP-CTERM-associated repeat protein
MSTKGPSRRVKILGATAFVALSGLASRSALGQPVSTWRGGAGTWNDGSKWSTDPVPPNVLLGGNYAALINSGVVSTDAATTIALQITLSDGASLLHDSGGGLGTLNLAVSATASLSLNNGLLVVDSQAATPALPRGFVVGNLGTGNVTISSGGSISNVLIGTPDVPVSATVIGAGAAAVGHVTVTGAGSRWDNSDRFVIAFDGQGVVDVMAGGVLNTIGVSLGRNPGGRAEVTVDGPGSSFLETRNGMGVGEFGTGTLTVSGGGTVTSTNFAIGNHVGAMGKVAISGTGSHLSVSGDPSQGTNQGNLTIAGEQGPGGTGSLSVGTGASVAVANTLVIWPGGTTTLAGGSISASTIALGGGTLAGVGNVASPVQVLGGGTIVVPIGGTLMLSAPVASDPGSRLIRDGDGTLIIAGAQLHRLGASLAAIGGTTILNTDAGRDLLGATNRTLLVSVGNGTSTAEVRFADTQHLDSLVVDDGSTAKLVAGVPNGRRVIVTSAVDIIGSGRLDLADNAMVVDYAGAEPSPLPRLRARIASAYAGGAWSGAGIASSTAGAVTGLGYAEAGAVLAGAPAFLGEPVDGTAVLVRYTAFGDANLDARVDFLDLVRLAQNYNTFGGNGVWSDGDFNYDGNVDFNDLVKLAQNYNTALSGEPVPGAGPGFQNDLPAAFAAVPEPSVFSTFFAAAYWLRRQRSSRSSRSTSDE